MKPQRASALASGAKKAIAANAAAFGREFERHQSQLIAAPRPRAAYAYLALLGIIAQRASTASAGWMLEAAAAAHAATLATERPLRGGRRDRRPARRLT